MKGFPNPIYRTRSSPQWPAPRSCSPPQTPNYFELANNAILSIRDKPEGRQVALGVFDLGCTPEQRQWLRGRVDLVEQPQWEHSFTGRDQVPAYYKGILARPFLRKYFPGFDLYLWIDADAWVQDWRAVELFLHGARRRTGLAIVPELDRGNLMMYGGLPRFWHVFSPIYEPAFGAEVVNFLRTFPILNAGVFALHKDAPHWEVWAECLQSVCTPRRL